MVQHFNMAMAVMCKQMWYKPDAWNALYDVIQLQLCKRAIPHHGQRAP